MKFGNIFSVSINQSEDSLIVLMQNVILMISTLNKIGEIHNQRDIHQDKIFL